MPVFNGQVGDTVRVFGTEVSHSVDVAVGAWGAGGGFALPCPACTSCVTLNECCGDTFSFSFTDTEVIVTREGPDDTWGQDLKIRCFLASALHRYGANGGKY